MRLFTWDRLLLTLASMMATQAGSECPRYQRRSEGLPLTSRSSFNFGFGGGGKMSETCIANDRHMETTSPAGTFLDVDQLDLSAPSRSLSTLHGDVITIGRWTCSNGCIPEHGEQANLPGYDPNAACTEGQSVGSLELQDDIDLTCLGSSLTCDDIENNETWKNWREDPYSNCDQDPDLLWAECELVCRFGIHPTKRCTYKFDRNNVYGMHGQSGMYGYQHCILLMNCPPNATDEDNTLYCNITDSHAVLFSSSSTSTTKPSTSASPSTSTTSRDSVPVSTAAAPDDGGTNMVVGVLIGGGAVGAVAIASIFIYIKVCRKIGPPPPANLPTGVAFEPEGPNETVVVGRPVAPAAGEIASGPMSKGDAVNPGIGEKGTP